MTAHPRRQERGIIRERRKVWHNQDSIPCILVIQLDHTRHIVALHRLITIIQEKALKQLPFSPIVVEPCKQETIPVSAEGTSNSPN